MLVSGRDESSPTLNPFSLRPMYNINALIIYIILSAIYVTRSYSTLVIHSLYTVNSGFVQADASEGFL